MRYTAIAIAAWVIFSQIGFAADQPARKAVTINPGVYAGTRVLTALRRTASDVQCFGTIGESHPVAYTIALNGRKIEASDGADPVRRGRLLRKKGAFKAKARVLNGMYLDRYKIKGTRFNSASAKIVEKFTRLFAEMPSKGCTYTLVSDGLVRQ